MKLKFFLGLAAFFFLYCFVGTVESTDKVQGHIIDIAGDNILVEDERGYLYEFIGDGYTVGEKVTLTFFNGGDTDPSNDILTDATPF